MTALDIVRRVAGMPCICHPMHFKEGDKCLGDHARELLGLPKWEHKR